MKIDNRTPKLKDVFTFRYKNQSEMFEPNHCFDGQLVIKKYDGELILEDTYWSSNGRRFKIQEAIDKGEMKFVCNLNEVSLIKESETVYYDDSHIFNLSYQHGCYRKFAIKKGAKRSAKKMIKIIEHKISDEKYNIKYSNRNIELLEEKLKKVKNGDIKIYI